MTDRLKEKIFTAMAAHHGVPRVNPRLTREKLTKPPGYRAFLCHYEPAIVETVHGFVRLYK